MIDYEMLCQTIEDWRAGRRPSIDLSAAPASGQPEEYAEVADHDYDDGQYAEPQPEYEEYPAQDGHYAEPGGGDYQSAEGYEDVALSGDEDDVAYEHDGAPLLVEGGGTAPVLVEDLEPEL